MSEFTILPIHIHLSLYVAAALISLLLLWLLIRRRRRLRSASYRLDKALSVVREEELHQIIIPDGIGGLQEIERLIRTPRGLLIVETYSMAGNMFGADQIDLWSQIVDGRSYKFANPLRHIRNARLALKLLAPEANIFCRVVFTADTFFPKGKPDEVSTLETLKDELAELNNANPKGAVTDEAWSRIKRIARKDGQSVMRQHD